MKRSGITRYLWVALGLLGAAALSTARAGNVTNAGDDMRTGWYPAEGFITPAIVSGGSFGQRWNVSINGQVYAQPLYANGQVLVATETNWVYSIDADTGAVLWSKQLGVPWNPSDSGCNDLTPSFGVTGTPVIDDDVNTVYMVSKTYDAGSPANFMHALDLLTGAERPGFPVKIQGSAQNSPTVNFDSFRQMNRPGLLLMDGVVYAAFGSHCDFGTYQGWLVGVNTSGAITTRWTTRATAGQPGAAIWHAGGGPVSDGSGRIFFTTGNGGAQTTATPGTSPPGNCGECVERVDVQTNGSLLAKDFFSPSNANQLDLFDQDLGSCGPAGLPSAYFGTSVVRNLLVQSGKEGYVYLMDRDALGGLKQGTSGTDKVVQRLGKFSGGVWAKPAVWPGDGGYIYIPSAGAPLRVYRYGVDGANKPQLTSSGGSADNMGFGSSAAIVTSDGTTNGSALVWLQRTLDGSGTSSELRAYSAVPVSNVLTLKFTGAIGTASKFTQPGAGRSQIYVGTRDGHIIAFGAPPAQLTLTKAVSAVHLEWSSNAAPYTLRRADDVRFRVNKTTLVDKQPSISFDDPVLNDGLTHFYLVN